MISDFLKAQALAGQNLTSDEIVIDDLGCPHSPKGLPDGKMGIYTFQMNGQYLKIGKAGPNSDARFRSQHYNPHRAKSNLARSLLDDVAILKSNLSENNIEDWIKNNTRRIDILLPQEAGIFVLNFLEAFLHLRCNPKYEGFEAQR